MIKVLTSAAGNVVQVLTYRDGFVEPSICQVPGHGIGLGKFTPAEAREQLAPLQWAIGMVPSGWREAGA